MTDHFAETLESGPLGEMFDEPEGFRPPEPEPTIHNITRDPALVKPGPCLS